MCSFRRQVTSPTATPLLVSGRSLSAREINVFTLNCAQVINLVRAHMLLWRSICGHLSLSSFGQVLRQLIIKAGEHQSSVLLGYFRWLLPLTSRRHKRWLLADRAQSPITTDAATRRCLITMKTNIENSLSNKRRQYCKPASATGFFFTSSNRVYMTDVALYEVVRFILNFSICTVCLHLLAACQTFYVTSFLHFTDCAEKEDGAKRTFSE